MRRERKGEMTMISWIKTFSKLALTDFKSIPSRLCRLVRVALTEILKFQFGKVYEEKSLFFGFLFVPVIIILTVYSKIRACRRGLSLGAFLKLERAELEAEAEMLRQEIQRQRIKKIEWLINAMPGATVNDLENLIERRSFRSLIFLRNGLWKLILGDNDKKGD